MPRSVLALDVASTSKAESFPERAIRETLRKGGFSGIYNGKKS